MDTFLFDAPVFGPVISRRLGVSLGINLLPPDGKVCSFNCLYCECGLNEERRTGSRQLPSRTLVREKLEERLQIMKAAGDELNVITFAGNGEPTLHPEFAKIVEDTLLLRDRFFPKVKISVLSNATQLGKTSVSGALAKIDNNILKLDSAVESTFRLINNAQKSIHVEDIICNLSAFRHRIIIQTLFCKGEIDGVSFDNTTDDELNALIKAYKAIRPDSIMIYSLSRNTPVDTIYKVEKKNLEIIATKLRENGFTVEVA